MNTRIINEEHNKAIIYLINKIWIENDYMYVCTAQLSYIVHPYSLSSLNVNVLRWWNVQPYIHKGRQEHKLSQTLLASAGCLRYRLSSLALSTLLVVTSASRLGAEVTSSSMRQTPASLSRNTECEAKDHLWTPDMYCTYFVSKHFPKRLFWFVFLSYYVFGYFNLIT